MRLSISDLKDAIDAGVAADARLAALTYKWGLYQGWSDPELPVVEAAVTFVPAQTEAQDSVSRTPVIEMHILRTGGASLEVEAEADARAAEEVIMAVLNADASVIAFELRGWEFRPGDDGGKRVMRTVVSVGARYIERLPSI